MCRTYQHVMSHHIFPNIDGFDADIDTAEVEFRRIKESQKYFSFYQLQSIYSPALYVFLGCAVRVEDLIHYFQQVSSLPVYDFLSCTKINS